MLISQERHFDPLDIHFVDGTNLLTSPEMEYGFISKFFGVEEELKFKFNPEKGFDCLSEPVEQCLQASKGKLTKLYEFMNKLLRFFGTLEFFVFFRFLEFGSLFKVGLGRKMGPKRSQIHSRQNLTVLEDTLKMK